ncbi:ribosome biogenesis GTPase Der [Buchnera aphidicola]|uniref:ribosome biogenesis GTPase Der n=1 Tax=Buchnera aphidicola TaxID=9 RepID=UPI003463D3CF
MQFTITIIGRLNVGKSTLFNKLTKTKDALTNYFPGLTRDRKYGYINIEKEKILLIDTAGIILNPKNIEIKIFKQTITAIKEANLILFIVNNQDGLMEEDKEIARKIRTCQKNTIVIVNKSENLNKNLASIEFHSLGFKEVHPISAIHGTGINSLINKHIIPLVNQYHLSIDKYNTKLLIINKEKIEKYKEKKNIKIAVLGKPNVGKSTLINTFLKEERVITDSQPGTTRDSIWIPIKNSKKNFTFIDTAGVNKKNKKDDIINKIIKKDTLKNIKYAHIVLIIIDATENITDQDISLCNTVLKTGRAIIIVINKCDMLKKKVKQEIKKNIKYKLRFLKFTKIHYISAIQSKGIKKLYKSIHITYKSTKYDFNTSKLTKIMENAIKKQEPPTVKGSRIKLKYAHAGGHNPPTIIIHGKKTKYLSQSYKKYLKNYFQNKLELIGSSINLYFKDNINPYKN